MTPNEFLFAWEDAAGPAGPWSHLEVVRFSGHEAISELYRYDIVLLARRPAPEVEPDDLVGRRATLRIATLAEPPCKLVHGRIAEAEELGPVSEGMLYRVLLMPPLIRARHRTRCRIFLDKTLREIVDAVLTGDWGISRKDAAAVDPPSGVDPFAPAAERFAWRVADPSRIDDIAVRPYCVQYNESDLSFVSRLLEEEGIGFHFENGDGLCLLVLSDSDEGKRRPDPFLPLGRGITGRDISSLKLGARLRGRAVRLMDFDWRKPALDLSAEEAGDVELLEEHYPGGFQLGPGQGALLARRRLERHQAEARYATGSGTCRLLSAGSIFCLDEAIEGPASAASRPTSSDRYDGEYLVTRLDVRGAQEGVLAAPAEAEPRRSAAPVRQPEHPWTATFEAARRGRGSDTQPSRFRPPRVTPKPCILGSQTAFVTAEPSTRGAEVHVGGPPDNEIGCVRLRFHWDKDASRHAVEPTSCWVRVSHALAGAGEGAVWHPRVGAEVIVDFIDGDPDRPIVTGRVYNGQNRPPAPARGAPTISTIKSFASPGGGVFNEIAFDDAAGKERVTLHAGRDWNSDVGHDRSERVANDSGSSVRGNRCESTDGDRRTEVMGSNSEEVQGDDALHVGGDRTETIDGCQKSAVGASRTMFVAADAAVTVGGRQSIEIGGDRAVRVSGSRSETIAGNATESVDGNRSIVVGGSSEETVTGSRAVTVAAGMVRAVTGDVSLSAGADVAEAIGGSLAIAAAADAGVQAGANLSMIAAALAMLQGANVNVSASGEIVLGAGGSAIRISGAGVEITGASVKVVGSAVDVAGGVVKIN